MTKRILKASTAALLSTSAYLAIATPAQAQSLDVPAGATHTLTSDESADTLTGAGTVQLSDYILTIGADGSSSTFDGAIESAMGAFVGSWNVSDGPLWSSGSAPTFTGQEAAAYIFGGSASDYRISTVSDQIADINDSAWVDLYAAPYQIVADDYKVDNGNGIYDQYLETSAFVRDHVATHINYAFTDGSGLGGLTKVGSGTLTLNGTGSWGGQTQVLGGTLQGTTASISGGSIVNNASLVYTQNFDGTVTQDISGSGNLSVAGLSNATLTFAGDIDQTTLYLNGGNLVLGGTNNFTGDGVVILADNSGLTVASGASISAAGTGVIGASANVVVDNHGSIAGNGGNGVQVNSATITNQLGASITGANSGIVTAGTTLITNHGSISGGLSGSNQEGISVFGGSATITNDGLIAGGGGNGIYGHLGTTLNIANLAGGSIQSSTFGVAALGTSATINNAGSITGGGFGIYSGGTTAVDLTNAGDIVGASGGINAGGTANTITNTGRIASGTLSGGTITTNSGNGLVMQGGTLDNRASGEIRGGWGALAYGGASVTNAGTIAGADEGLYLGLGGSVTNSGSISGGNAAWYQRGVLVQNAAGTVTNLAGGTISGGRGVDFEGVGGTVDNAGTINATVDGVMISASGSVTNQATGMVNGHDFGVRVSGADSTVTNSGAIHANAGSANFYGVRLDGTGATLDNHAGAVIDGGSGVYLGSTATVTNDGQISSFNVNGDAVQSGGALSLTNKSGGSISGARIGVGSFGSQLTLTNAGTIAGNAYGAVYTSGGTNSIVNQSGGSIVGNVSANGLNLRGDTTVDNAGLIEGSTTQWSNGIYGAGGTLAVTNSGSILSHLDGNGIEMEGGTLTLVNDATGSITQSAGDSTWGVLFYGGATGSVDNAGMIFGETGVYADTGSANVMVANSGTIEGTKSAVVTLGSASITNLAGGTIVGGTDGAIIANTDGDVSIDLRSGSGTTGNVVSLGTGGRSVSLGGSLAGAYDASAATGVDSFTLAATGSMASAMLGDGDDSFTTFGGAITGNVDGGAGADSLTFEVAGNVTYGGNFTAFETGTKTGTGRVSLTGTNSVNTMFVNGGILAVNGILASTVTVNAGGTLGGTGTVNGSLVVATGGHLAPGNSIGTITVNGPVTFASGSTYDVEINPTSSDKLVATGAVTINGGTVNVIGAAGVYAPLTTYQIIQGASVTGTFTSVVDNLAFLDPTLTYTANSVNLVMRRNDIAFAAVASNANQRSVANGVQSLGIGALYDAVLVQDGNGARAAYDALAGAVHPSIAASLAQRDRLRTAQLDQAATGGEGLTVWADASAGTGNLDATGNGAFAVKGQHRDLLAGVRYDHGPLSLVAGGGRMQTDIDQRRQQGSGDVGSWLFGGQVGYRAGAMRANVGLTYADHDIDVRRDVRFPGFAETLSSSRGGSSRSVYGELAYATDTDGLNLEPFAGASWQKVSLDPINESGGLSALSIDKVHMSSTLTEVGIRFSATQLEGHNGLYPMGTLAWQHRFGDRHADMTATLSGGDPFTIHGAALSRDALRANVGVGYRMGATLVGLTYDGRLAGRDTDHAVRATLSIGF